MFVLESMEARQAQDPSAHDWVPSSHAQELGSLTQVISARPRSIEVGPNFLATGQVGSKKARGPSPSRPSSSSWCLAPQRFSPNLSKLGRETWAQTLELLHGFLEADSKAFFLLKKKLLHCQNLKHDLYYEEIT